MEEGKHEHTTNTTGSDKDIGSEYEDIITVLDNALEDIAKKLEIEVLGNEHLQKQNILNEIEHLQSERKRLKRENLGWEKIVEEMKDRVECQVCLILPKDGPVPMCPNGHFICTGCKGKREQDGKVDCPSCKVFLGEIKCLLATTVIENVKHECDFKGCKELVHFSDYKNHQENCPYRPVKCPGGTNGCNKLVAFNDIGNHLNNFHKLMSVIKENRVIYHLKMNEKYMDGATTLTWDGETFCNSKEIFYFRIRKVDHMFEMEVVMKGSKEGCGKFKAEISIYKPNILIPVMQMTLQPRPISQIEWGTFCLVVPEKSLATVWRHDKEKKMRTFKIMATVKKVN